MKKIMKKWRKKRTMKLMRSRLKKKQNKSMIQVHFTRMLSLKTYFCLITFLLIYDSFPFSPNSNTYYSTNSGFNIQEEKETTQEKKQVAAGG